MVLPDVKIVDFEYNSGPPLMTGRSSRWGELTVEEETVLLTSYYSEPAIKWETNLPTIDDAFAKFGAPRSSRARETPASWPRCRAARRSRRARRSRTPT